MRIVVAPDEFRGALSSRGMAAAIAEGWARQRPDDHVVTLPMADGGPGTARAVARGRDRWQETEVADALGRPHRVRWLLREDGSALVEAAAACGLDGLAPAEQNPMRATSYGVGQLLEAVRRAGAPRVVVAVGGGLATDGGAGALIALGYRVQAREGGGLKIGGRELIRVGAVAPTWLDPGWMDVAVTCWTRSNITLEGAATTLGVGGGAAPDDVAHLTHGLGSWGEVVERDLGGRWRDLPGSGAGGGLAFGLAAGVGAELVSGPAAVAESLGLPDELERADVVVTGGASLRPVTADGGVLGYLLGRAAPLTVPVVAVVGRATTAVPELADAEETGPFGADDEPLAEVAAAASRLAARGRFRAPGAGKPER